jgi:hypothetical protein
LLIGGGRRIIFARKGILDAEVMVKGAGPETGVKTSAGEHGTEGIADGLVCSLDRAILVRTVCAGGADSIAVFFEKSTDLWIVIEFSSLIERDIFIRDVRGVA